MQLEGDAQPRMWVECPMVTSSVRATVGVVSVKFRDFSVALARGAGWAVCATGAGCKKLLCYNTAQNDGIVVKR